MKTQQHKIRLLSVFPAMLLACLTSQAQTGNEVLGDNAAPAITTGDYNVVVGSNAGVPLSEGSNNVLLGHAAAEVADPNNAVLIGADTGRVLASTATGNTFIGDEAGLVTTTGFDNTFLGSEAGESNTTGYSNLFLGEEAGSRNTTGYENVFIGENAADFSDIGFRNLFLGVDVGGGADNAWGNVGVGYQAFNLLSDSVRNTAIGHGAMHNTRDAVATTAVGSNAGNGIRYADFGVMIGALAGRRNNVLQTNELIAGDRNTNVGMAAGYTNELGEDNVVVGAFAGSGTWNQADLIETNFQSSDAVYSAAVPPTDGNVDVYRRTVLGTLSRGSQNETIAIGYGSKSLIAGGIAFGNNAQATHTNSMVIGQGAVSQANDTLVMGNDVLVSINPDADGVTALGSATERFAAVHAVGFAAHADAGASATVDLNADAGTDDDDRWQLRTDDGGALAIASFATGSSADRFSASSNGNVIIADTVDVFSDGRLKQGIKSIGDAMKVLRLIDGRSYEWRPELNREEGLQYGVIAQDVENVLPEIVHTNRETGIQSVNYQALVPFLINGLKEQQSTISGQDASLQTRAELIANNQSLIDQQGQAIQQMQAQLRQQQRLLEQLSEVERSIYETTNLLSSE